VASSSASRREFSIPGLSPPISHYCDAVKFGNLLFISGIGALDKDLNVIGGDDVVAQAEAVFSAIDQILKAAGAGFKDILKVTVLLTDVNDRIKINPVRQKYFGAARPASTLFEVSKLAIPGMKLEIEAVAGLPE
jgi:2-iminobutanoate/2-iminopropanoate deaminase